jgi:uncharacterized protein (DUF1778 family)
MAKAAKRKTPPSNQKGEVVRMRITAEHKQALQEAARKNGLELSQWLRQLALRAAGVLPPGGD